MDEATEIELTRRLNKALAHRDLNEANDLIAQGAKPDKNMMNEAALGAPRTSFAAVEADRRAATASQSANCCAIM